MCYWKHISLKTVFCDGRFKSGLLLQKWFSKKKSSVLLTKQTMSLPLIDWRGGGGGGWGRVGADDNLSLLEHSEANQMHSCGYYLKLHVTKVLVMLENFQGSFLHKHRHRLSLHFRYHDVCVGRGWIVPCHPWQRTTAFLGKFAFYVPTERQQGCPEGPTGMTFFWHDGYISQPVHLVEENSFKLLICTLP